MNRLDAIADLVAFASSVHNEHDIGRFAGSEIDREVRAALHVLGVTDAEIDTAIELRGGS